jgi:hypothetical protein
MSAVRGFVPVTEVIDHIRAHPEEHDQFVWICGTRASAGGRAILLAGYEPVEVWGDEADVVRNPDTGEELHVWDAAVQLMQLTVAEAGDLFAGFNDLDDLEGIAAQVVARQRAAGILPAPGGAA